MGSYGNPLVGSGWNNPQQQNPMGQTSPINLSIPTQTGSNGVPFGQGPLGNPAGFGDFGATGQLNKNVMLNNVIAGQYKNALAPQYAQLMGQYGAGAGRDINSATNFFQQLMNLGSPFYQQRQTQAFNQGVQQNQNAGAQARQQINAAGYGYAPSGLQAATAGGLAQQGSQNLAEQYLQNLFQNELLQGQGAQGVAQAGGMLGQLAGLFNPAQLLGGTSAGAPPATTNPSGLFTNIMQGIFGNRGAVGAMPQQ